MHKNLNLSEKEFNKLVKELKNGNEELFVIAFKELVVSTILYLEKKYNLDSFDLKDAASTALFKLRNGLIRGDIKPLNIRFLFLKMVYNEYIKIKTTNKKVIQLHEEIYVSDLNDYKDEHQDELFKLLNIAIKKLEKQCVELLNHIYKSDKKLSEIAEQLNINYDTLRKRKQRCIENLRMILKPLILEAKLNKKN